MFNRNTDRDWERFGRESPYFGVLTDEKYLNSHETQEHLAEFFQSGEDQVRSMLQTIHHHLDPDFSISTVLDFGCGVGRTLIPLAKRADSAVGMDVSSSMLLEAEANCRAQQVDNVRLVKADDDLSLLENPFNLIHSFIVLQHIPVRRGSRIFENLLSSLEPGGVGVLHLAYAESSWQHRLGASAKSLIPLMRNVDNLVKGKRLDAPQMQMNCYDLNTAIKRIQELGVSNVYADLTDHGGTLGVVLYFMKPRNE